MSRTAKRLSRKDGACSYVEAGVDSYQRDPTSDTPTYSLPTPRASLVTHFFPPDSSSTANRRPILPKQTQLQNSTLPTHVTTAKLS
jgi:hypothetical protein